MGVLVLVMMIIQMKRDHFLRLLVVRMLLRMVVSSASKLKDESYSSPSKNYFSRRLVSPSMSM